VTTIKQCKHYTLQCKNTLEYKFKKAVDVLFHLIPSWADLDVLEAVNRALSPLMEFTDALSGEEYVTISFVKPVLHILNSRVLAEEEDDVELTKQSKPASFHTLRRSSLKKKKLLLIIYSPPCHPRCFFSRNEIKVFDENIPGFFFI